MKKKIVLTTLIVLVLAFTTGAAGAQPAQAANSTLISAGWMPFAGSFPDSNINLNGLVHIVERWTSVSSSQTQVDIEVSLPAAGVTVTTDTGIPYSAFGGGQSSVSFPMTLSFPTTPSASSCRLFCWWR